MALFKCKMCGGNLDVQDGMSICECEYCGSTQTIPNLDNEKKITLFSRANRLRSACEFDKAFGVYENIVTEFEEEAEAYWGLILCKYGIEYVDDSKTGKKIPTCHRSSFESVFDDSNFDMVMECSDPASRVIYREEAKVIEELRARIIEVSSKEESYDIFICYKETDLLNERTIDSVIAQDVYDVLVEKGYKVFFSRITLEDKLGQEYEPYIFAALNSAKIMLVFGTDYEYFNAVWVKNEWSRFLGLIENGEKKTLIPCYKGIDAYDMPKEFAHLQAQDMGKVGAIQDLVRGIGKILGEKKKASIINSPIMHNPESAALVQRGIMALEDMDFKGAESYFERALDINPTDAQAYLGKFLALHGLTSLDRLRDKVCNIEDSKEFRRAEQFADVELAEKLLEIKEENQKKIAKLTLTDALRKYAKNKVKNEYEKCRKEIYEIILCNPQEGKPLAEALIDKLVREKVITQSNQFVLKKRIGIVKEVAEVLGDYEVRSPYLILSQEFVKGGETGIDETLNDLVYLKCIEKHPQGYCLNGSKEIRTQREAYKKVCEEKEKKIQLEADREIARISEEYEIIMDDIEKKIKEEISLNNQKRELIEEEIRALQKEKSTLGFFKVKEKQELQAKIDVKQACLIEIINEQKVRQKYRAEMDKIVGEKNATIDKMVKELRIKYIMPCFEEI